MPSTPACLLLATLAVAACRHELPGPGPADALVGAVRAGDLPEMLRLLDAGANPDSTDRDGRLPLVEAAAGGSDTILAELLAEGADVTRRDGRGYAALDQAVAADRPEAADRLVRAAVARAGGGPRVQEWFDAVRDPARTVPPWQDLLSGELLSLGVIDAALHDRADVIGTMRRVREIPNASGYTAMAVAARWGHDASVAALLAIDTHPELPAVGPWQATPLMLAAGAGHAAIVGRLLRAGARPATRDAGGDTALHWAARGGDPATLRVLLAGGADPATRNAVGATALDVARAAGHDALVPLLDREGDR